MSAVAERGAEVEGERRPGRRRTRLRRPPDERATRQRPAPVAEPRAEARFSCDLSRVAAQADPGTEAAAAELDPQAVVPETAAESAAETEAAAAVVGAAATGEEQTAAGEQGTEEQQAVEPESEALDAAEPEPDPEALGAPDLGEPPAAVPATPGPDVVATAPVAPAAQVAPAEAVGGQEGAAVNLGAGGSIPAADLTPLDALEARVAGEEPSEEEAPAETPAPTEPHAEAPSPEEPPPPEEPLAAPEPEQASITTEPGEPSVASEPQLEEEAGAAPEQAAEPATEPATTEPNAELAAAEPEPAAASEEATEPAEPTTEPEPAAGLTESAPEAADVTAIGGGGGDGVAIEPAAAAPPPPDLSQAPPVEAMATIATLPPAQMGQALGGVDAATQREVGAGQAQLAAAPPSLQRPSGSPPLRPVTAAVAAARDGATASAPAIRVERAPAPSPAPRPGLTPLPPRPPEPTSRVAAPLATGNEKGQASDSDAAALRASVEALPVSDPGLNINAGPAPTVQLSGDADPRQAVAQRQQLAEASAAARAQARDQAAAPLGEAEIYPAVSTETLTANVPPPGAAPGAAPAAPAVDPTTAIVAAQQGAEGPRAAAAQAQAQMIDDRRRHDEKVATEQADSRAKIDAAVASSRDEQEQARLEARAEVVARRREWVRAQDLELAESERKADLESAAGRADVAAEAQKANREAAAQIERGNREATARRESAEAAARTERERGRHRSSGVLGWLSHRVVSFFERVRKAIRDVFEAARTAVLNAVTAARDLAGRAIDAARTEITKIARRVGAALIAIGGWLQDAFARLRDRFKQAIKKLVAAAVGLVNFLAEKLKQAVSGLLDFYAKALSLLLDVLATAYRAVVKAVGDAVRAAIDAAKAAIQLIGVFAALVGDIAANPGRWLRNLGAAIVDGLRNHLWKALKAAVKNWFNQKVEEIVGLAKTVWTALVRGRIRVAEVARMVWQAIISSLPMIVIQLAIEKLISLLIPAASALMLIIEGLKSAWGALSKIIAAIQALVDFLKAVKTGTAGPRFARLIAAGAVALIDFLANFLISRLGSAARGVSARLRALATRIGARLQRLGTVIARGARRVAAGGGRLLKRLPGVRRLAAAGKRLWARGKARVGAWRRRRQEGAEQRRRRRQERRRGLGERAVRELPAAILNLVRRGVGRISMGIRLFAWKRKYGLRILRRSRSQGGRVDVEMANSPLRVLVRDLVEATAEKIRQVIHAVGDRVVQDPEVRRLAAKIMDDRSRGGGRDAAGALVLPFGHGGGPAALDVRNLALRDPGSPPRQRVFAFGEEAFLRHPGAAEHLLIGGGAGARSVRELQTLSFLPGHIVVETGAGGRYAEISRRLSGLPRDQQQRLGSALWRLQEGGVVQAADLAALNRIPGLTLGVAPLARLGQVEMGRGGLVDERLGNLLLARGQITPEERFGSRYGSMTPRGAAATARAERAQLSRLMPGADLAPIPGLGSSATATHERINVFIRSRLRLVEGYVIIAASADPRLFEQEERLRNYIYNDLRDHLVKDLFAALPATASLLVIPRPGGER